MSSRQLDLLASGAKSAAPKESRKGGEDDDAVATALVAAVMAVATSRRPPPADASLAEEAQRRYLNYAVSVITSRALPDVRDGLKPVQRRILYAMYARPAPLPRRQAPQVRDDRRRGAGQVPPARRHRRSTTRWSAWRRTSRCACRWSTATATSARSTATPPRPTATPRPAGAAGHGAARRAQAGDGRLPPQLRRHDRGADRAAGALPQPAGQRLHRHRGRHGDQHPAAQPGRGVRGGGRADRRPQARDQGPAQVHQGPGLPHRRPDHQQQGRAARDLRDRAGRASGCAASGRSSERQARRRAHRHHVDPLRGHQVGAGRADRRGDHRQEAAHAGRRARRVDRRRPHRARAQAGRRPGAGDGVPLQAHAAAS